MYFSPFPTGFDVQLITSVYPFFKVLHCKVIVKTPVVDVPQEYLGNESIPPAAWSFLETDKVNYLATIKDRPAYLQNRHVHSEPSFSKKVHMSAAVFFLFPASPPHWWMQFWLCGPALGILTWITLMGVWGVWNTKAGWWWQGVVGDRLVSRSNYL